MNKFSGLGITSAFCPTFLLPDYRVSTLRFLSRSPEMYKIATIYSVNGSQESRET